MHDGAPAPPRGAAGARPAMVAALLRTAAAAGAGTGAGASFLRPKLIYLPFRAMAETSRMILAHGRIPYDDEAVWVRKSGFTCLCVRLPPPPPSPPLLLLMRWHLH